MVAHLGSSGQTWGELVLPLASIRIALIGSGRFRQMTTKIFCYQRSASLPDDPIRIAESLEAMAVGCPVCSDTGLSKKS